MEGQITIRVGQSRIYVKQVKRRRRERRRRGGVGWGGRRRRRRRKKHKITRGFVEEVRMN